MKPICVECGHSYGHHHQNCPEIQEDADIEITVTSEAEDGFNQFDLIP
jgi:hypothetical protein